MTTGTIATVGTFDGYHRGHRQVVATLLEEGRRRGLRPLLVTFSSHPLQTVAPERAPKMLDTVGEKMMRLRGCGAEVVLLDFNASLCSLTAEQWMRRLRDEYGVRAMVVGYDNTFGCDGRFLRHEDFAKIGESLGIKVIEAPELPGISSSTVRKAVLAGDVEGASRMLGRPYELRGEVVHGRALGRQLGFPTANLVTALEKAIPADGVYAVSVEGAEEGKRLPAVINIGRRPSVDNGAESIECHIPGFAGDLYGRELTVRFIARLRGEKKYPNLEVLREGIARDVAEARRIVAQSSES